LRVAVALDLTSQSPLKEQAVCSAKNMEKGSNSMISRLIGAYVPVSMGRKPSGNL